MPKKLPLLSKTSSQTSRKHWKVPRNSYKKAEKQTFKTLFKPFSNLTQPQEKHSSTSSLNFWNPFKETFKFQSKFIQNPFKKALKPHSTTLPESPIQKPFKTPQETPKVLLKAPLKASKRHIESPTKPHRKAPKIAPLKPPVKLTNRYHKWWPHQQWPS